MRWKLRRSTNASRSCGRSFIEAAILTKLSCVLRPRLDFCDSRWNYFKQCWSKALTRLFCIGNCQGGCFSSQVSFKGIKHLVWHSIAISNHYSLRPPNSTRIELSCARWVSDAGHDSVSDKTDLRFVSSFIRTAPTWTCGVVAQRAKKFRAFNYVPWLVELTRFCQVLASIVIRMALAEASWAFAHVDLQRSLG